MKHVLRVFSLLLLLGLAAGCQKSDPEAPAASAQATVTYDTGYNGQPASAVEVKLENVNTKETLAVTTDAAGVAKFGSIPAGAYNITVTQTLTPAQFLAFAGVQSANAVVFQASLLNQTLTAGQTNNLALVLKAGTVGELLIKQVYYAGSDRVNGAVFRDQFIELYNNTDAVLYADGLYLAQVEGNRTVPATLPSHLLASGQYDWTKSVAMPATVRANDDYVYAKALYQIPGAGKQYPVQPGQSIVIAQSAINHKSSYVGNDGKAITVRDPSLTIDLSNASFETYFGFGLASDVDNPAVPNMRTVLTFGNDMILDNKGRDGFAIFRSGTDAATFPKYPTPNTTTVSATTRFCVQIPKSLLLDAVECQESSVELIPKKFTSELDAGYVYAPKGEYTSQALIRKVARTFGTRRVLQDTNNSTNDFQAINLPTPFAF